MNIKTGKFYDLNSVSNSFIIYMNGGDDLTFFYAISAFIISVFFFIFGLFYFKDLLEDKSLIFTNIGLSSLMGLMFFLIFSSKDLSADTIQINGKEVSDDNFIVLLNAVDNNYDYIYFMDYENDIVLNKLDNTFYTTANLVNKKNIISLKK